MSARGEILVPLDGSRIAEQAIGYAQVLLEPGAALSLLQVVPDPEPVRGLLGDVIASVDELREMYEEVAEESLEETAERWSTIGVQSRREVRFGDPAERILRLAEARGVGLIVMTSHGRGAVGRLVFGSVADEIVRTSSTPVMVIHPGAEPAEPQLAQIQRLVVPLDGSLLAERALPVAEDLAKRLQVPVLVLRSINPSAMLPPSTSFGRSLTFPETAYLELSSELKAEARDTVTAAADRFQQAGVAATWKVLTGPPFASITDVTQAGDIVVLASHGRGGLRRWILGSNAEKLIRSGSVPVVVVPAGNPGEVEAVVASREET